MAIEPPQIGGLTDWRPLARGGFSVVWEARQETLDRLVAVKVDQRRLDSESERQRFLREAGAAGKMSGHPGIVTVHDAGILADHRPYLVMELCPGGSLTAYLNAAERPTPQRVRDIGVRIADALAATHARGVLHRDVKPANVLVDAYDQVGLADFGLAAMPGPGLANQETFEAMTPAYTAPEVLRRKPPTEKGDVYSLGATLYALLTGRPPRWPEAGHPGLVEVLRQQSRELVAVPGLDPAYMAVLESTLAMEPERRPDATELRNRLAALDLGRHTPAPAAVLDQVAVRAAVPPHGRHRAPMPVGRRVAEPDPEPEPSRRRRPLLASLGVLVLLVALVTGLVLANRGSSAAPVAVPTVDATSLVLPSTAAATPTPVEPSRAVLAGFVDCSGALDQPAWCSDEYECWGLLFSYPDTLFTTQQVPCAETHVYQTFAAAPLPVVVRRQSKLNALAEAKRLCRRAVLDRVLPDGERAAGRNWEIKVIPPQSLDGSDDGVFRCVFGDGERQGAIPLVSPR